MDATGHGARPSGEAARAWHARAGAEDFEPDDDEIREAAMFSAMEDEIEAGLACRFEDTDAYEGEGDGESRFMMHGGDTR